MSDLDRERAVLRGGLAYFGRMMASISHEMNNVVTIIGEVSGLVEDMTALAEAGRPLAPERLRVQCERIGRAVERGKEIVGRMNALAHSVDHEEEEVDLDRAVEATVGLLRRLAELRGVAIEVGGGAGGARVRCSRFELQQAIYVMIDALLASAAGKGTIRVDSASPPGSAEVMVGWADGADREAVAGRVEYARLLAGRLGGDLEAGGAGAWALVLRLPARP